MLLNGDKRADAHSDCTLIYLRALVCRLPILGPLPVQIDIDPSLSSRSLGAQP